jgi:cytochrome c oxidase cbb3-type subunit III
MRASNLVKAAAFVFVHCAAARAQEIVFTPASIPVQRDEMREALAIGSMPEPAAVERGHRIFTAACAFCHGTNATGGNSGPDLVRSVLVLHDAGSGKSLGPVVRNGRVTKGMPQFPLTDVQIEDVAAFLLERSQSVANRYGYQVLDIVTGDAKAGQVYFDVECRSCHSPTKDLAHIASKYDPVSLQNRFLYPDAAGEGSSDAESKSASSTVTVTLPSGVKISGGLLFRDDFRVTLIDQRGKSRVIDFEDGLTYRVVVVDSLNGHELLLKRYSDADMHNVLAYLETLK